MIVSKTLTLSGRCSLLLASLGDRTRTLGGHTDTGRVRGEAKREEERLRKEEEERLALKRKAEEEEERGKKRRRTIESDEEDAIGESPNAKANASGFPADFFSDPSRAVPLPGDDEDEEEEDGMEVEEVEESEEEEDEDEDMEPTTIHSSAEGAQTKEEQSAQEAVPAPVGAMSPADVNMMTPVIAAPEEVSEGEEANGLFSGGEEEEEESGDEAMDVSGGGVAPAEEPSGGVKRKLVEEEDYD